MEWSRNRYGGVVRGQVSSQGKRMMVTFTKMVTAKVCIVSGEELAGTWRLFRWGFTEFRDEPRVTPRYLWQRAWWCSCPWKSTHKERHFTGMRPVLAFFKSLTLTCQANSNCYDIPRQLSVTEEGNVVTGSTIHTYLVITSRLLEFFLKRWAVTILPRLAPNSWAQVISLPQALK